MTQEELKRINRLNRDIRDYEDIVKSKDTVISIGCFSEDERQALYTFMEQRCAILRANFAALRVESGEEGQ